MRLRIIAGRYGNRQLVTPATNKTHPMGERMRGALFNIIGEHIIGAHVCDAFAGSGAVGLEAISRGAASAVMIERDRVAQRVIAENIDALGVGAVATLMRSPLASWSQNNSSQKFDIIIADPPYHDMQLGAVSRLSSHLNANGLMVLSYPGRESAPTVNGVVVVDKRLYGDAALAFYRLS